MSVLFTLLHTLEDKVRDISVFFNATKPQLNSLLLCKPVLQTVRLIHKKAALIEIIAQLDDFIIKFERFASCIS
jgi:hypothetical protein